MVTWFTNLRNILEGMIFFTIQKIITRYRRIGYNLNVMRQSVCLVFNPIMVDNYAAFFNCTLVGRASDSMMARLKGIHFSWLGPEFLVCCLAQLVFFFCSGFGRLFGTVGQLT